MSGENLEAKIEAAVKNPRLVFALQQRTNNPPPDKAGPADD